MRLIPLCTEENLMVWEPNDAALGLAREFNCSKFLASLLWMKGVTPDSASGERMAWLSPDLSYWLDRTDLGSGAQAACDQWSRVGEGSNVLVYGDFDVDGITATTFMMELALQRGASVRYYFPHRFNQGYGFHSDVVSRIARSNWRVDLLVAVDCGTQSFEAARIARENGIPTIVFDHHLSRGDIAPFEAVVNPQIDGNDLAKCLCAAGVVWSWAWKNEVAPADWLRRRLDIASLATVADCVNMSNPVNRAIVREGLAVMRSHPRLGLEALMNSMSIDRDKLDSESLAMRIIPCLNAAGRLKLADLALKIFFPSADLDQHVSTLVELNKTRRSISTKIVADIESEWTREADFRHVLYGDEWPAGVLSSVASRLCAERDIPVALAAPTQGSIIRGSLRVPPGQDAEAVLGELSDDLVNWGGHRVAAGFSVETKKWLDVRRRLEAILASAEVVPEKQDVLRWSPAHLDLADWKEAEGLGPFGIGNCHPLLYCSQEGPVCAEQHGSKGGHARVIVEGRQLLAFGGEHLIGTNSPPSGWIYKPRLNYWRNRENLQLVVEKTVMPPV